VSALVESRTEDAAATPRPVVVESAGGEAADPSGNLRIHLVRAAARMLVLGTVDAAAVLGGRALLRAVRDSASVRVMSDAVVDLFPQSFVTGPELVVALILALLLTNGYRAGDYWRDPVRTLAAAGLGVGLAMYGDLWSGNATSVLARALLLWVSLGLTLVITRFVLDQLLRRTLSAGLKHRVVEISGDHAQDVLPSMGPNYRTVGRHPLSTLPDDIESMEGLLAGDVDTILLSGEIPRDHFTRLTDFALAHGCRLLCVPRPGRTIGVEPRRVSLLGHPYFELTAPHLRASQLFVKRAVDVLLSVVALIVLSPILLLIALIVRLDSPGPIFFRQRRAGYRGRFFELIKFRSMRVDAEQTLRADPEMFRKYVEGDFKLPESEDPRITRVGRFLRKTSLDELPQFVNVLCGQMSLVGPRPVVELELEMYRGQIPTFLSVRPGVTGLWQISGRSDVGFPERAEIDLEYVRRWSLLRDLWILFMTVPAVLFQRGAH